MDDPQVTQIEKQVFKYGQVIRIFAEYPQGRPRMNYPVHDKDDPR